jgi:hypothetical protein
MMSGILPGASGSQAGFSKSIRKGLNGGLGRLDLTRAGLVAGHFGVKKLHAKELPASDSALGVVRLLK